MKAVNQMRRPLGRKNRSRNPRPITHYFRVRRSSRRPIESCPIPTFETPVYSSSGSNSPSQVCIHLPISHPRSNCFFFFFDIPSRFADFGWWIRLLMSKLYVQKQIWWCLDIPSRFVDFSHSFLFPIFFGESLSKSFYVWVLLFRLVRVVCGMIFDFCWYHTLAIAISMLFASPT